jgi:hypothetical protein
MSNMTVHYLIVASSSGRRGRATEVRFNDEVIDFWCSMTVTAITGGDVPELGWGHGPSVVVPALLVVAIAASSSI